MEGPQYELVGVTAQWHQYSVLEELLQQCLIVFGRLFRQQWQVLLKDVEQIVLRHGNGLGRMKPPGDVPQNLFLLSVAASSRLIYPTFVTSFKQLIQATLE